MMTDHDRAHALRVVNAASEGLFNKYHAGCQVHGGWLPGKGGLLGESWAEAIDLVVYLETLREQLAGVYLAIGDGHVQEATSALRLILFGDTTDTLPGVVIKP